ncbi:hypothetical protein [Pseudoduganella buxea]|uniref:Transmembrane protein n=1 Tax=Pseudoduganella buxea TaxID=1949069 RepID=A0A6I3T4A8_9BURK|nr:hypothetical protein [Pseudoduganella buxea]MTV56283.1 hypothetical protein [Pseudoduganella buxea]GGC19484.1 hypothetical protein GCM10011572_46190 [Pseudoduganella buxea]
MKEIRLSAVMLDVRLRLLRAGPAAALCGALLLAGVALWAWLLPQRTAQLEEMARPLPAPSTLAEAAPPPTANENLAAFYATLGQKRHAEQQVKVLFDLAAKLGLVLDRGEYKFGYDKGAQVATYQITLPVKGPYGKIWQFTLQALAAMPFAALDDVNFRRDTIADTSVDARLRFTLYLKEVP